MDYWIEMKLWEAMLFVIVVYVTGIGLGYMLRDAEDGQ